LKRRSDTKHSVTPPSLVYFVDRCLGRDVVPQAIVDAGFQVEIMNNHFDHKTKDHEWIPEVAAKGWVIVTKDKKILRRPPERAAVERSGAHYVAVVGHGKSGPELALTVGQWIERVDATIHAAKVPSWFRLREQEAQIRIAAKWRPLRDMHTNPKRWRSGKFK
jgi:hypothetical protein